MFLVDTNIWLERLLEQEKSKEVADFLNKTKSDKLFITDFTFHTICVIMSKHKLYDDLLRFVQDIFINGAVNMVCLSPADTKNISKTMIAYDIDFDDAYQYESAIKYNLAIVSFDRDYDKTKLGRKTPNEILNKSI